MLMLKAWKTGKKPKGITKNSDNYVQSTLFFSFSRKRQNLLLTTQAVSSRKHPKKYLSFHLSLPSIISYVFKLSICHLFIEAASGRPKPPNGWADEEHIFLKMGLSPTHFSFLI